MSAAVLLAAMTGLLLLASALAKAIDLRYAASQVAAYGLVPVRRSGWLAGVIACVEAWLAAAMLVAAWHVVPLITACVIGAMTLFSLLRARSRGLADCGCHGRLLTLSPGRSAVLHGIASGVLIGCWWAEAPEPPSAWGMTAATAVALAVAACAWRSAHHGALLQLAAIRAGRPFPARLLARVAGGEAALAVDPSREDAIVALFSLTCPICGTWARVLDAYAKVDGVPPMLGLVGGGAAETAAFGAKYRLSMDLAAVGEVGLMALGASYPMAVEVRGGVVREIWTGHLPQSVVAAVRSARDAARRGVGAGTVLQIQ